MEKRIEVIENFPVQKIKNGFGNPRKIKKKKAEELQQSFFSVWRERTEMPITWLATSCGEIET